MVMVRIVEAIYDDGVLRPVEQLPLSNQQRVRLTIEPVELAEGAKSRPAIEELICRLGRSTLYLNGPAPTREELHDRNDLL
jgi:predicted DNA-binding antitoxin AbrB/MazE fold protein